MKKKRIFPLVMSAAMTICLGTMPVHAEETGPYIANPSFEQEIDTNENQMYKAERTDEKAFNGKYSIKVGSEEPEDPTKASLWAQSFGKGSVNVVIHNVKPNTQYAVTSYVWNKEGNKIATGVVDIDGRYTTETSSNEWLPAGQPWLLASDIKGNNEVSEEWQKHEHMITTGPRTTEIYAFAYTDGQAGMFYFDDVSIQEVGPAKSNYIIDSTLDYNVEQTDFPNTVPAVQEFNKAEEGQFKLSKSCQVFSTDKFSEGKTQYLAKSMKEKGVIKDYSINVISNLDEAKGITLFKKSVDFDLSEKLPKSYKEKSRNEFRKDAYQIDIAEEKLIIKSDYIEGIQNGSMTILQSFVQRDYLNCGTVNDYTDQTIRGLQVDSGRRYYSVEWIKNQIEQMAYYKQNRLQLRLKDNEGIRWDSKVAPDLVDRAGGFWTAKDIDEMVAYAAKFNIEIVPEVDFPGHSAQETNVHPEWKFPKETWENQSEHFEKVIDLSLDEPKEYMLEIYKEAAELFHAKTIHLGGDEYYFYFSSGQQKKTREYVRQATGDPDADYQDAVRLFMNDAASYFLDKGMEVIVWSDVVQGGFSARGVVDLDKRIVIDVWAGGQKGNFTGTQSLKAGYQTMSSAASLYHDLWPKQGAGLLDRPLPKDVYEQFTRWQCGTTGQFIAKNEKLDVKAPNDLDKFLGQMFPIWDDAHGYVPEYILSRTLFPRYAGFALKTWGAEYNKPLSYLESERLAFALESPTPKLVGEQTTKNYTQNDFKKLKMNILDALDNITPTNDVVEKNIDALKETLNSISTNKVLYSVEDIENIIHQYENITVEKEVDKADYTKVDEAIAKAEKLNKDDYVDFSGVEAAIKAVEKDLDITDQDKVDAMAKAIEDAMKALEKKPDEKPTPENKYEIIDGKEVTFKQGEKPVFKSNAPIDKFKEVLLDGKVLDKANYTVEEGSTVVTLKAEFTETLSKGTHTLTIVSTDGQASTEFKVEEKTTAEEPVVPNDPTEPEEPSVPTNPENPTVPPVEPSQPAVPEKPITEDGSQIMLWTGILAVGGLAILKLRRKKDK